MRPENRHTYSLRIKSWNDYALERLDFFGRHVVAAVLGVGWEDEHVIDTCLRTSTPQAFEALFGCAEEPHGVADGVRLSIRDLLRNEIVTEVDARLP